MGGKAVRLIREAALTLPDYPAERPGETLDQDETCDVAWVKTRLRAFLEEDASALAAAQAQAAYERQLIDEARALVAGTATGPVTVEHLRVLLGLVPSDWPENEDMPF